MLDPPSPFCALMMQRRASLGGARGRPIDRALSMWRNSAETGDFVLLEPELQLFI